MNFKVFISIFFAISLVHCQATQLEVLEAINFARTNPEAVAGSLVNRITRLGKKGIEKDENCWQEAADFLRTQAQAKDKIAPISEEIGLDMAAYVQSKDMLENIKDLNHIGSDKSTVEDRMRRFGRFTGSFLFFEIMSTFVQTQPVSADKIVQLFITDCGNKGREHRKLIFNPDVTQMGASVQYSNKRTYITILAAKNFRSNAVSNKQMSEAWIDGEGKFTGEGRAHPEAKWRYASEFVKNGAEIYDQNVIDGIDMTQNELGDAKDDGSQRCPTFINPEKLAIRVVKAWRQVQGKCNRNDDEWQHKGRFIKRVLPFAKGGKCFHRLFFCDTKGAIFAHDWEYKTWDAAASEDKATQNIVKIVAKDDLSVKCPEFINSKLEKKLINDWYMNGEKCVRGKNEFANNGFQRINPYATDKKCFHQLRLCSEDGQVWLKDTEYVTFAEFMATHK